MKVGYIRASRQDQNPHLQHIELDTVGCEKTFEERTEGGKVKAAMRKEMRANTARRTTFSERDL